MASHAYSTSASSADAFTATLHKTRRRALEDWIERALAVLDSLDADPEAEDDGSAEHSRQHELRGGASVAVF